MGDEQHEPTPKAPEAESPLPEEGPQQERPSPEPRVDLPRRQIPVPTRRPQLEVEELPLGPEDRPLPISLPTTRPLPSRDRLALLITVAFVGVVGLFALVAAITIAAILFEAETAAEVATASKELGELLKVFVAALSGPLGFVLGFYFRDVSGSR